MSKLPKTGNKIKEFFKNLCAALFVIFVVMLIGYFGGKEIESSWTEDDQKEWLEDMQKLDERLKKLEEQKTSSVEIKPVIAEMTTEEIITKVCKENGVPISICLNVAKCESNFNSQAVGDGEIINSRGLFQISEFYHPQVSDEEAFDPIFATKYFCQLYKQGKAYQWSCYRKLYN